MPDTVASTIALPELDAAQQRVLGSLLEKEVTVPASCPMSVNAVRTACNQASSREPVVEYDEALVHRVLRELKELGLVAVTWADSGRRTLKYVQTLDVRLGLAADERALLTALVLRGPQAPGALRSRTERLHPFADRAEAEACLRRMADRGEAPPLVRELPKRPREQDRRWVHLLGPAPEEAGAAGTVGEPGDDDREWVLRDGEAARTDRVRAVFEAVATPYAARFSDELGGLPFERWVLDRVVAEVGPGRPVVEVGCGPGHVTAHLAAAGLDAEGLDLSSAMVAEARARHPDLTFTVGDLRTLMRPAGADGWGAVLAWYSLIYLAPSELAAAVAALVRPVAAGGLVVLALHAGSRVRTADSWFDRPVELEVALHEPAEVVAAAEAAGLVDVEWFRRSAVVTRGETSERLYVLGRRPVSPPLG